MTKSYAPFDQNTLKLKNIKFPGISNELQGVVNYVNQQLFQLQKRVQSYDLPEFNSSLVSACTNAAGVLDSDAVIASTVSDRFVRKFQLPADCNERELKSKATGDWIDFERDHLSKLTNGDRGRDFRKVCYRIKPLIHEWLRDFEYYYARAPIDFGPGESFISRQGDSSVLAKLEPSFITVTHDALDSYVSLCVSNRFLRDIYVDHFRLCRKIARSKGEISQTGITTVNLFPDLGADGYLATAISEFMSSNNLIQHGSRGSSVYKDVNKRRFINVECSGNIMLQKMTGWAIKMCLKYNADCDLFRDQMLHVMRISDPSQSTADETNASDSVHFMACQLALPSNVLERVSLQRSSFILLKCPVADRYDYFPSLKVSSMGNGFTFELLSLINLAVARLHDSNASVYGDDVIISNDFIVPFVEDIERVGFIINTKKSFFNSPLRESCGGFYLDGYGYITCYDIKYCNSFHDVIILMGKLFRIVGLNVNWDHPVKDDFHQLWLNILPLIPNQFYGPLVMRNCTTFTGQPDFPVDKIREIHRTASFDNSKRRVVQMLSDYNKFQLTADLPEWVETDNYMTKARRSKHCRSVRQLNQDALGKLSLDYQLNSSTLHIVEKFSSVSKVRQKVVNVIKYVPLQYAYLWAGRRTPMTFRHASKWRTHVAVVDEYGNHVQLPSN